MDQTDGRSNRRPASSLEEPEGALRKAASGERKERSGQGGGRKQRKRRRKQARAIAIDLFAAAFILLAFYMVSYKLPTKTDGKQLATQAGSATAQTSISADTGNAGGAAQAGGIAASGLPENPTASPPPESTVDPTPWRVKFADKFTGGAVEKTDTTYKSANVNIRIDRVQTDDLTYFLADIYVADIRYFRTAFAKKADVMGGREAAGEVATQNQAIIAINGDHCVDNNGPVIRNGKLYREETFADILVMNSDGSMQTIPADQVDMNAIQTSGAWQVWTFGPMLLQDGQPMTQFNSTLNKANPRTAVGYYEPGHYCFLVVDGRQSGYSEGMTLKELSQFCYDTGCKVAFNLDGGRSSEMIFLGQTINRPYDGGRSTTDILMIVEE